MNHAISWMSGNALRQVSANSVTLIFGKIMLSLMELTVHAKNFNTHIKIIILLISIIGIVNGSNNANCML